MIADVELREEPKGTACILELFPVASEIFAPVKQFGGDVGSATETAKRSGADIMDVIFAGYQSIYFHTAEEAAVLEIIDRSRVPVVIFNAGTLRQETQVARYRSVLIHAPVVVSGGAVFHFLPGAVPQALRGLPRLPVVLGTGQENVACRLT